MIKRTLGLVTTVTLLSAATAIAAPVPERIRGMVSSVSGNIVTVHTTSGNDVALTVNGNTQILRVVKSDLDHVQKGSYVGTAAKSTGSALVALEVVVFPPPMRGVNEGHFPWDRIPDTTLSGGSITASTMTNGNVATVATPHSALVDSTMTNGDVSSASTQSGAKQLTVTYKGGQQTVLVPPTAPIITFEPGAESDLAKGVAVFVSASEEGGTVTANFVAVGAKGIKPPM
jgi:hypothetical protein